MKSCQTITPASSQASSTGKNAVEVKVEDLGGRTRQASATLLRRGPPPALTPEATDLWKK
jgi:hypothetical protein